MNQSNCLNFCEILEQVYDRNMGFDKNIKKALKVAEYESWDRLYLGSYFCSTYFLRLSFDLVEELVQGCTEQQKHITLVVPIFTQRNLIQGKEKIREFLNHWKNCIDEVTVNDYGMLKYIHETYSVVINLGRLFMKDHRDPRFLEYFDQTLKPMIFTSYLDQLIQRYEIQGMEFDPTHRCIDFSLAPQGIKLGLHIPYCYMTTGQICEMASIPKNIEKKFRPNDECTKECERNLIQYKFEDGHQWCRIGRTIYFDHPGIQIEGTDRIRHIFFPFQLEVRK